MPPGTRPTNGRTPIPGPTDTNGSPRPEINNSIPPANQGTNNAAPGSTTQTPTPVTNGNSNLNTNTNVVTTPAPSQPEPGLPVGVLLVIIAAIIVIVVLAVAAILYKLKGPNTPPGPTDAASNVVTPSTAAIKIKTSVDTNPKMEIEGGELPSLDTGISIKLKLDAGQQSSSEE